MSDHDDSLNAMIARARHRRSRAYKDEVAAETAARATRERQARNEAALRQAELDREKHARELAALHNQRAQYASLIDLVERFYNWTRTYRVPTSDRFTRGLTSGWTLLNTTESFSGTHVVRLSGWCLPDHTDTVVESYTMHTTIRLVLLRNGELIDGHNRTLVTFHQRRPHSRHSKMGRTYNDTELHHLHGPLRYLQNIKESTAEIIAHYPEEWTF